ncbi:hypothetical protein [Nocardia sp. NBC_01009]|uniref:hypothetical protein n=1 Tax=Nocardia sp. NBC_01009 TaxID=2975996 RepID=UPI00386AC6B0|nr:hypothetical protein OHA42_04855 [Nocardia sp. NBC_01009]
MRTTIVLAIAVMSIAAGGCASDAGDSATPSSTTYTVQPAMPDRTGPADPPPTTTAAAASDLRAQSCQDILPMLDEMRATDPAAAARMAQQTIDWFPTRPEWAGLSEADRAATIAGVRDAAAGSCPS